MATNIKYEYPINSACAETVATMPDGTVYTVNTQYGVVSPHGEHANDCDQTNKMGGRCTCGLLDGIDCEALIIDARQNGKLGRAPTPDVPDVPDVPDHGVPPCPKCHTWCHGDCEAN